ncbi:PREDICTED: uncharacterized protein LOC104752838 [Camelina sativa]|uniref:Uncharacterized protein LOC104752838 n=1 Tax=Camelina sativa TaxID=90675 RepID=A0ABM1QHG8_CAMSA|nr:PREDICTED: uncharacterized protein LOC104752838 [Camelina sativa]
MTTSIEAKNKLGFVDGSIIRPAETDPYYPIWKRCNSMVKSWMLNSVMKQIYSSILYFATAAELWKDLYTRFHKSNLPRLYSPTDSFASSSNYDTVRSQIPMKKSLPSLSEVYNMLDQDDSQRSAAIPPLSGTLDSSAFQVTQQQSQGTSSGGYNFQRGNKPVCTFCGRTGHVMDKCYKKNGYPVGHPRFKSSRIIPTAANIIAENDSDGSIITETPKLSDDLSTEQMQQIVSFLNTRIHSSAPTPEVHAVSVSSIPSSLPNGPTPGSFSGLNDWNG